MEKFINMMEYNIPIKWGLHTQTNATNTDTVMADMNEHDDQHWSTGGFMYVTRHTVGWDLEPARSCRTF
jgi:hypothetical protein